MLARFLVFLGGLLVVVLFAALIAPMFVDWTDFRRDFERQATSIMGRPVVVHGRVDARLLPFPSVTMNDVRVGEEGDDAMVRIARFSMDAELAPFLSGEALIFDMRIDEPKARIKLLADGTLDWAKGRKSSIPARNVVLENVAISKGEIEFVDEQTGRTRFIGNLNAALSARSLTGPWRIEGQGALDGEKGRFSFNSSPVDEKGVLRVRTRLIPETRPFGVDLEGDLQIVDFKPQYTGSFTLIENKEAAPARDESDPPAPRVNGLFELTNERIRVPEYRAQFGAAEDPYIVTGEATLDTGKTPEFLLLADGQQIDVSRIGNDGASAKTDRNSGLSVRQRLNALLNIASEIPIPQVPGRASLLLPAIVVGDTTVRDVRLDVRPDRAGWIVDKAVAQLPGRTQIEAKGRLTLTGSRAFSGDLLLASNQPSGLASWVSGSVDPTIRSLKSAGFSARVDLTDVLQRFEDLEIAAGSASLKGRLERQAPADAPPSLNVALKGNLIDVDALRALTTLLAGDTSNDAIFAHAINAEISAERVTAFGETAEGVDAVLTLRDGVLKADRLSINALEGSTISALFTASGTFDAPSLNAKMKLAADDLAPLLKLVERHTPAHPALTRLAQNGSYYQNADLDFTLATGSDNGSGPLIFGVIGSANGSRITAHYQAPSLVQALAGSGLQLEATLENPSTLTLLGQVGFDPLPFDGDENGVLTAKMESGDAGEAKGSLTFTTNRTSLTARGRVGLLPSTFLNGEFQVSLDSADLEPYLLMGGVGLPQMGAGLPFTLAAKVGVTPDAMALTDMSGKVDRNGFAGTLTLDRNSSTIKGNGALTLDHFDIPLAAETVIGPVRNATSGGLSTEAIPARGLEMLDVSLDLSAKQADTGLYGPVADFKAKAHLSGGELALREVSGAWLGGALAGDLVMTNASGSASFNAKVGLTGADLAAIGWTGEGGQPIATGKLDLNLSLEGAGQTITALAEGATGSGEAVVQGVTLYGLNDKALAEILPAVDALEGELTAQRLEPVIANAVLKGETVIEKATIPLAIAGGTLRAQNVMAVNGAVSLSGNAALGLASSRMDADLTVRFPPPEEQPADSTAAVRLNFAGLTEQPGRTLDSAELANYLTLRAFERERRRVETLQANVLEKQRLRREAALYKARAEAREAARQAAAEEDARRKAQAEAEASRRAAEEAERKAQAERDRLVLPQTLVDPSQGVTRGEDLQPLAPTTPPSLNGLPGVDSP